MLRTFRNGILEAVHWDDEVRRLLAACLSIIVASFRCVVKDYVCCALHCNPSPEPEALQVAGLRDVRIHSSGVPRRNGEPTSTTEAAYRGLRCAKKIAPKARSSGTCEMLHCAAQSPPPSPLATQL